MAVQRTNPTTLRPLAPAILGGVAAPPQERSFTGPARLGARTKHLVKRLRADDIAIIDHAGIDRVAGEDLVATGCRCVVNVAPSVSPRYSNQGPAILVAGGVHLVDMPGAPLFEVLHDGQPVTIRDGRLIGDGEVPCGGEVQHAETVG